MRIRYQLAATALAGAAAVAVPSYIAIDSRDSTIEAAQQSLTEHQQATDRLVAQVATLTDMLVTTAAARDEMIASRHEYAKRLDYFRMPTQSMIVEARARVSPHDNPLHEAKSRLRAIKRASQTPAELWAGLRPYAENYRQFGDRRDLAIGAMLAVGALYDYGNPTPNDNRPGCVSINETTDFKAIPALTHRIMMETEIGCCTDFALLLSAFLSDLSFETEVLMNASHQAVRFRNEGEWHYLDANALIFVGSYFGDGPKKIHYYTPFSDSRVRSFQHYMIPALTFGLDDHGQDDWRIVKQADHFSMFNATHLAGY